MKKKICFVDYDMTVKGGAETVVFELTDALKKKYDVYILGIKAVNRDAAFEFDNKIEYNTLNIKEVRFRKVLSDSIKKMKDYIRTNKIDIVVMNGTAAAFVSVPQIFLCRKTRFVFFDHGALINEWNDKEIRTMRWLASIFAEKTIVLTEQNKEDYQKKFHLNKKKLLCIPNWISERFIEYSSEYDKESKRILSVGRFGKEKGYDLLVKAAKNVFARHSDWVWDVYGDGETFKEISEEVRKNGLTDNVLLHGNAKSTLELYGGHAMLVLPSYREGLPLVLLEAKANHLPCISFDVKTGPSEIIQNNINGYLIQPYDTDEMGECICKLIEDSELRREFSVKSAMGMEKFAKNIILKSWIKLIEEK